MAWDQWNGQMILSLYALNVQQANKQTNKYCAKKGEKLSAVETNDLCGRISMLNLFHTIRSHSSRFNFKTYIIRATLIDSRVRAFMFTQNLHN